MCASLAGAAAEVSAAVARTAATVSRSTPSWRAMELLLAFGFAAAAPTIRARFCSAFVGAAGCGFFCGLSVRRLAMTSATQERATLQCLAISSCVHRRPSAAESTISIARRLSPAVRRSPCVAFALAAKSFAFSTVPTRHSTLIDWHSVLTAAW
jgi:hypothetical protein